MEFNTTKIEGLILIKPKLLVDQRGYFFRTYCKNEFSNIGLNLDFVQFNHSFNKEKGTLRGMHFQKPPYEETKLIRCVEGSVYDVIVDLRKDSKTYMQYDTFELSKENNYSILVPFGCAHGFQTLADNTSLIYHHTQYYNPIADAGIRHDDPSINISWPMTPVNVSEKDMSYEYLKINL